MIRAAEPLASLVSETLRVLLALPLIEAGRRFSGPRAVISRARAVGGQAVGRAPGERARLQAVIRRVDRWLPDGGNCYRRALVEIALDAGAAAEPLTFGFRQHGGPKSGHAWLAGGREAGERYDAEFVT
jgi:hypothetical protein